MIPIQLEQLHRNFFNTNSDDFDLSENEGCGEYTEAWVVHAQAHGFAKVGHLKKNPGQTQYNGHANDAFLYREAATEDNPLYQAVDIIARAEAKPPYTPSNQAPGVNFGVDIPRYKDSDWLESPDDNDNGDTPVNTVPYVPYDENGFQRLKKMLAHDYARRPQGADFDVSVWAGRYFHNCYMGPSGTPLGEQAALERIKPELCASLHIPIDDYYGT